MIKINDKYLAASYSSIILNWIALVALTILAVSALSFDLGSYAVFVALFVAFTKAFLILHIFMDVSYNNKIFKMFMMVGSLVLITVLIIASADLI